MWRPTKQEFKQKKPIRCGGTFGSAKQDCLCEKHKRFKENEKKQVKQIRVFTPMVRQQPTHPRPFFVRTIDPGLFVKRLSYLDKPAR
ncbi:hypothetical protein [Spirosoma agri]|uniref:Uncharacterized protein n=1 Tax=Spirosoma agri TaxID=1987381 RepID=A0A6M0IIX1_9BACT|nr:hypothetical protein [Spirosoma agri]NEU68236.1 hypothetical protein [Spirosoma agri]